MRYYQSKPDWDETGRLRHIGLARGEVAPAVLMPGDPGRCEAMQRLFAAPHFVGQRGAFATYTGETSGGAPISVMSSGMGCMNVSLALEELSHLGVEDVYKRQGSGSNISRLLGQEKKDEADRVASTAFFTALLLGLCITVIGLLSMKNLMRLLGATETILPYAQDYARYILFGAPIMCASFVMNNDLRSEGKAVLSMMGIATGGVLNIALDPLFIFVFDMGISGAAIATLLSQCISFCILLSNYLFRRSTVRIAIRKVSLRWDLYQKIVVTGMPSFFRQALASFASISLNVAARAYGDPAVAAMSVAVSYTHLDVYKRQVLHQQPEEVELLGGEGQGPPHQGGGAALPVQGEVAVAQGGALVPPLKDAPDLGQEDVHVVGLFDVVVRPQAQPGQFVLLFRPGAHHQDGQEMCIRDRMWITVLVEPAESV